MTLADNTYADDIAALDDTQLRDERTYVGDSLASLATRIGHTDVERFTGYVDGVATLHAQLQTIAREESIRELRRSTARRKARRADQDRMLDSQGKLGAVCAARAGIAAQLAHSAGGIRDPLVKAYVLDVLAGGEENANDTVTERSCEASEWHRMFIGSCASITCDAQLGRSAAALAWLRQRGIGG